MPLNVCIRKTIKINMHMMRRLSGMDEARTAKPVKIPISFLMLELRNQNFKSPSSWLQQLAQTSQPSFRNRSDVVKKVAQNTSDRLPQF